MGLVGTFGSFTIARLGIYASQAALNVTGNNIANINTKGYTRQNLDQIALRTGGSDRYAPKSTMGSGNGVLSVSVSQTRDLYLDIRYRSEAASVGAADTWLAGLEDIARVLDEVGDGDDHGVIEQQFSKFLTALENLSYYTGQEEYEDQVRSAAKTLTTLFNNYATRLETVESNTIMGFEDDLEEVNGLIDGIQKLNSSIRKAELHGDKALELRDERNVLLDKLAQFVDIDVSYTYEDLGGGQKVEKLSVAIADTTTYLVEGIFARDISIDTEPVPNPNVANDPNNPFLDANGDPVATAAQAATQYKEGYSLSLSEMRDTKDRTLTTAQANKCFDPNADTIVQLGDNDLHGGLQSTRELLTEEGEFASAADIGLDPDAATKRGIPYYQKALDLLANKFASVFNEANSQIAQTGSGITNIKTEMMNSIKINGTTYTLNTPVEIYMTQGFCTLGTETTYGELALVKDLDQFLADNPNIETAVAAISDPYKGPTMADTLDNLRDLQWRHLVEYQHYVAAGTPLFSNSGDGNDPTGITAGNISISAAWADGEVEIVGSFTSDGSTANDNILHMVSLMDQDHLFDPTEELFTDAASDRLFFGSFQEMLSNINSTLGNDMEATETQLNTFYTSAVELDANRDNVSSVDLNDEAANLMQYSNSYSAACKLLTTLDEVLNTLINAT